MFTTSMVLRSRKGFATVFGLGAMALIIMFAVGVAVVNYSTQATLAAQTKNLTAAVESRANVYAAALNESIATDPQSDPDVAADLNVIRTDPRSDITTVVETVQTTLDVDTNEAGMVLTINASSASGRYDITREVELTRLEVTHVTGFDEAGDVKWANSRDTDKFYLWSFSEGTIRPLTEREEAGPSLDGIKWSSVSTRLGIDTTGHIWAWGANDKGQAGIGTTNPVGEPVAVTPAVTYRTVVSDATSSFAIDSLGGLWAWGSNSNQKLGLAAGSSVPVRAGINYVVQSVATSDDSTFAIDSRGRLWAWGQNASGRLGTGSAAATILNAEQVSPGQTYRAVATSNGSTYAIDTAGRLWAWGVNDSGQLGGGSASRVITSPNPIAPSAKFAAVSAGGASAAAVGEDGKLWGWGAAGRAGDGSLVARTVPVRATSDDTFTSVSVGATTSYAVNAAGKIHAWGSDSEGQYGEGASSASLTPKPVLTGATFRSFVAGTAGVESAAVDSRGGLWAFAHGGDGLWPIDFAADTSIAVKMPLPDGFARPGK